MVVAILAPGCGGQTGDDAAVQSPAAGTGGQRVAAGGDVGLGGASIAGSTGGAGAVDGVGGTGDAVDAGRPVDASVCTWANAAIAVCGNDTCCPIGCGVDSANTADVVDCRLQMSASPTDPQHLPVLVNCVLFSRFAGYDVDAGDPGSIDGWTVDYSVEPAILVFGAQPCAQLKQMGTATIQIFFGCSYIC